jgi:hypothetical protein
MRHLVVSCVLIGACAAPAALGSGSGASLVSVAAPISGFEQNKQNEPALAVDPVHPEVIAASGWDALDMEPCAAGDPTRCDRTPGVGLAGVYFSFDSGSAWTQPTYSGWTGRNCSGPASCAGEPGPIGTVPWYYESGLETTAHASVAFGPVPSSGRFSWNNGSRLYYATTAQSAGVNVKAFRVVAVSRTDDVGAAASGNKNAWCIGGAECAPVIVSKQDSASFSDVPRVWADAAATSPFFGNVYVCFLDYNGLGAGGASQAVVVARSTDGGTTWDQKQVSPGHNASPVHFGQGLCSIRTDSRGVVYAFYNAGESPFAFSPVVDTEYMVRSLDGGVSWTRPKELFSATETCWLVDVAAQGCVEDGIAGAFQITVASPYVDIANGAPSGADATNELVMSWVDGRDGVNHEHVMVSYSTDGGSTWSTAQAVESAGDRGFYSAAAISPNGRHVYVVYNAFTTPFQAADNSSPRGVVGVVEHADVGAGGALTNWSELHRSPTGDARASSGRDLAAEFLGFYIAAAATRTYGAGAWTEVTGADCSAVDAYRMSLETGGSVPGPAPSADCPLTFGNTDIFAGSYSP